jgi:two-component system, OmpR family, phosphate regulon sensor histidine kinase PhoR
MSESRPALLVVDDELGMREGIRRIFTLEGYEVSVAENGTDGIRMGGGREFDVALIDMKMPDIDGLTVLRALREKQPDTEYIMITAFAGIETAVEAAKTGAYTYVPKPFTPDQIIYEVNRALGTRRLTVEARELRAEQERRLLEVHREQSRLRTIINAINDAVFVSNLDDEIVLANPRTRALFNVPATVRAGDHIDTLFPPDTVRLIREAKDAIAAGVELVSNEWEMKPNLELVVVQKTTPLRDNGGEILGYVTTIQDVTELKRLDMQKSQFVSMVAHELKAPVAAVSGYLESMHERILGPDLASYDRMVDRSRERLQALIDLVNDLLNISRREMGSVRREITAVDVRESVDAVRELLQGEMDARGLRFGTTYDEDLPPLDIDRDEFVRVLTNLLSNAIKYNRPDGDVTVSAACGDGLMRIAVRDSGIGMRPEERERLFYQFYRIKNEQTRAIPGTGLGLSIVKQIVESYHGDVGVDSVYGEGTTFTLRIPVRCVDRG